MILLNLEPWQLALCFLPALLNMWAIWHSYSHDFPGEIERALWMVLAVFLPFIGGFAYLCFGVRRSRKRA